MLRLFAVIGGYPTLHGALMRDRLRQPDRLRIEKSAVADNKRRLRSFTEIDGCPTFTVR